MPSLVDLLDIGLQAVWPKRSDQRRLLDLGERKPWSDTERRYAVQQAVAWLTQELQLPSEIPSTQQPVTDALQWARGWESATGPERSESGVARWAATIAPALGVSGKRLANSCTGRLRSDRAMHRWLRVIHRIHSGGDSTKAWLFHERTPAAVATELGRLDHADQLDAGDALLLRSLLSLWQRRRPTERVRGNRARPATRRETPKPIAQLAGCLAGPGQLGQLLQLASSMPQANERALILIAVEAALTDAHLSPHPTHRGVPSELSGEALLRASEAALTAPCLTDEDRSVVTFRIQRMRAWRDRERMPDTSERSTNNAYVRASVALSTVRQGGIADRFAPDTPGLLMLLPQLRRHDLLEHT